MLSPLHPQLIRNKVLENCNDIATILPNLISSRLEDIHSSQNGSVLVKVVNIIEFASAKKEFYICDSRIIPDARHPSIQNPQAQDVLFFQGYAKAFRHYEIKTGDYVFLKNPIIVYEERGDEYTRVTIQVKPASKRKNPEVIFIKAPDLVEQIQGPPAPVDHAIIDTNVIPETGGQPEQKTPSKNVPAAAQSREINSPRESEHFNNENINNEQPPERLPEGQEVLLSADELVDQVDDGHSAAHEANVEDRDNVDSIDTSTPSRHAPRETSSISPIPSTSKKGSQENNRPEPQAQSTHNCHQHNNYSTNYAQQQDPVPGPSHAPSGSRPGPSHAPSGSRPGAFKPVENSLRGPSRPVYAERRRRYSKLNECTANKSKYNTYAVLTEIVKMPFKVKSGQIVTKLKIRDDSLNSFFEFRFDILDVNIRCIPSLEIGSVFRIHEMVVQVFNGVPDGRVYSGKLVTVVQGGVGTKIEPVYSNPNKELVWNQQDSERVEELRKWYDYIKKGGCKDSTIDSMNCAGMYNLYCKLVAYTVTQTGQHLLRVEDGTISTIHSVEHPDEETQDVFGNDKCNLDIYLVDELAINAAQNIQIESGCYLYLENIICTEAEAVQSQHILPPINIFKFTLDRDGRISIPNSQSTQCATLRERLGEESDTQQDSYINRVLALAQDGISITNSRLTSSILSLDSSKKVGDSSKEDKSCQTPTKSHDHQSVQTSQEVEKRTSKRYLCFEVPQPSGKRQKQTEEQQVQETAVMEVQVGQSHQVQQRQKFLTVTPDDQTQRFLRASPDGSGSTTSATYPGGGNAKGQQKGFLDSTRTTDESSMLPPGQWSYQRDLGKTPVEREDVSSKESSSVASKENSSTVESEKEKEAPVAVEERSLHHDQVVDNVSPVVSDYEDDPDNPAEVPESSANNDLMTTDNAASDRNKVTDLIISSENPKNLVTGEPSEEVGSEDDQDSSQKEPPSQSDTESQRFQTPPTSPIASTNVTPTISTSQQSKSSNSESSPGVFKISTIKKLYPRKASRHKETSTDVTSPLDLSNSSTDSSPTKRSSVIVSQKVTTCKTMDVHESSASPEAGPSLAVVQQVEESEVNIKLSLRSSRSSVYGSRKGTPVTEETVYISEERTSAARVVTPVADVVSPVDGVVSPIADVVSPVDGVVSPVPSISAGISSPSSVYSTAPEEPRVASPGDFSLTSQSSYHTGKSSLPRSHFTSSQGLASDPASQCISPVSEEASQSSFHTVMSSQHTEDDITEDITTESEDNTLHNKEGDISMDESEDMFESSDPTLSLRTPEDINNGCISFTVPERIPTPRTSAESSDTSFTNEGFLTSLIKKGIAMITPSKKQQNPSSSSETDLNKSKANENNLLFTTEEEARRSNFLEHNEHETAAQMQNLDINVERTYDDLNVNEDASKEDDPIVNEEITDDAKQSTSTEASEAASIRKRRRSSLYNFATSFKQGDSI